MEEDDDDMMDGMMMDDESEEEEMVIINYSWQFFLQNKLTKNEKIISFLTIYYTLTQLPSVKTKR